MKNTALVIMAAGIGSRFGGGIKQLEPVGPSGEIIMDYSIHDALEAGFNKIVFIIRKDLEKERTDDEFMAMYEQYEAFDDLEEAYLDMEEQVTTLVGSYVDNHLELFAKIIK